MIFSFSYGWLSINSCTNAKILVCRWFCLCSVCLCWSWGQSWRRSTECNCKIDWLWARSPLEVTKYLLTFVSSLWCRDKSSALSSATQHALPPELGGKWRTVCTRCPLPTLLCSGCSVKPIWFWSFNYIPIYYEPSFYN